MTRQSRLVASWAMVLALLLPYSALVRAATLPNFTTLVKDNTAAVVNIRSTQMVQVPHSGPMPGNPIPGLPKDSPFNEFFKRFFEERPNAPGEKHKAQSIGSGFIISSDGYILTNAHVVKNSDKLVVRLKDHREKSAELIGLDERSDVALLKIDAKDLPTVKIGNSDKLEVGQWVLAIGSPFGLEYTATQGIISALGRNLPNESYVPFIQTDVAVNPGNSGGPLFDTDGEVVGINSQIYSNTGGYMGLSFAIPINVAMRVADQLKSQGYVTRGWLGVLIQPVSPDLASSFGLPTPKGALIAKVEPGSPADKGGLKPGDIILTYNGKEVEDSAALPPLVGATKIDTTATLKILRNGKEKTIKVTIKPLSAKEEGAPMTDREFPKLHMSAAELTEAQRKELRVGEHGVIVTALNDGPASAAGIHQNDVLLMLNHHPIDSLADLVHEAANLPTGKPVPVLIQRDGSPRFLAITIPK